MARMKKITKHQWRTVFCLLWMGMTLPMYAQSVEYVDVHAPGGAVQSFELDGIRKITFTEQAISLHPVNNSVVSLLYDNVSALTFDTREGGNGIVPVPESGIHVYFDASSDNVVIKSTADITAVNLYNMQGVLFLRIAPQSLSASVSLSGCPAGVYIVQVADTQTKHVKKIIKQ
jgi:hypothetical protein